MSGITHEWNGTVLTITSDSGTSSCDLKGAKGDDGARGATGAAGKDGIDRYQIHIGTSAPTSPYAVLWIDTSAEEVSNV